MMLIYYLLYIHFMINSNNDRNVSSVIAPIEESGSSSCVGQRLSRIRTPSRRLQESNEGALRSRRMATVTTDVEELNNRRDEYVNRVESEANEFINKDAFFQALTEEEKELALFSEEFLNG